MFTKFVPITLGFAYSFEQIQITENGKKKTLYAVNHDKVSVVKGGNTIVQPYDYWLKTILAETDALGPNNYYKPNLLGGSLSYDVNLSQSECSCNAAVYMSKLPGKNQDGSLRPSGTNDFYCDANDVGGNFCPEFDIMEANKHAFHTTAHKCNKPNQHGYYDWCDKPGTFMAKIYGDDYGIGGGHRIDTTRQFHVKAIFPHDQNKWTVTLSQDGQDKVVIDPGENYDYWKDLKNDIKDGMAIIIQNWGGTHDHMKWLDEEAGCKQGDCDMNPTEIISNYSITTGDYYGFDFGDSCRSIYDGFCTGCDDCSWAWASGLGPDDKSASCRCKKAVENQFLL